MHWSLLTTHGLLMLFDGCFYFGLWSWKYTREKSNTITFMEWKKSWSKGHELHVCYIVVCIHEKLFLYKYLRSDFCMGMWSKCVLSRCVCLSVYQVCINKLNTDRYLNFIQLVEFWWVYWKKWYANLIVLLAYAFNQLRRKQIAGHFVSFSPINFITHTFITKFHLTQAF